MSRHVSEDPLWRAPVLEKQIYVENIKKLKLLISNTVLFSFLLHMYIDNSHGDCFISFLKDNRTVILNGRVTPDYNNYTFVSTRGVSVPDYIICPVDNLIDCESFKVFLMSDIINMYGLVPPQTLPDHSFLMSTFVTNKPFIKDLPKFATQTENYFPKRNPRKNLNNIDSNFTGVYNYKGLVITP